MAEFLEGYSSFYSHSRRIDLNNHISLYWENGRAGFILRSTTNPDLVREVTYGDPSWCSKMSNLIDAFHETGLGEVIQEASTCEMCEGTGLWTDVDGDSMACPGCAGG